MTFYNRKTFPKDRAGVELNTNTYFLYEDRDMNEYTFSCMTPNNARGSVDIGSNVRIQGKDGKLYEGEVESIYTQHKDDVDDKEDISKVCFRCIVKVSKVTQI